MDIVNVLALLHEPIVRPSGGCPMGRSLIALLHVFVLLCICACVRVCCVCRCLWVGVCVCMCVCMVTRVVFLSVLASNDIRVQFATAEEHWSKSIFFPILFLSFYFCLMKGFTLLIVCLWCPTTHSLDRLLNLS